MNGSGKTAAAAGGGATGSILLIKLFAYYGLTLTTPEALALAGVLAPVLHGLSDGVAAMWSALISRIK
jgi:hypothetical protein